MIARPFVTLVESAMKQHRLKNVAELASLCKGQLSPPALYAILAGHTPNSKAVGVLSDVLGVSLTLAVQAREEQLAIDKSFQTGRGRKAKKKADTEIKLTVSEKNVLKKLRSATPKQRKFIQTAINLVCTDKAKS